MIPINQPGFHGRSLVGFVTTAQLRRLGERRDTYVRNIIVANCAICIYDSFVFHIDMYIYIYMWCMSV